MNRDLSAATAPATEAVTGLAEARCLRVGRTARTDAAAPLPLIHRQFDHPPSRIRGSRD